MNESNVSGKLDQAIGKVKQGVGEAIGNDKLANEGLAQQTKGAVKETWGNAKDAASDINANAHAKAQEHSAENRESLSQKIDNAKAAVNDKIEEIREKHTDHRAG